MHRDTTHHYLYLQHVACAVFQQEFHEDHEYDLRFIKQYCKKIWFIDTWRVTVIVKKLVPLPLNRNSWDRGELTRSPPRDYRHRTVRSQKYLRLIDYWCSHRIQFSQSVSFPHCKPELTKSNNLYGNQRRDRGIWLRIIWSPPILVILIGRIWCHRITTGSEQRIIEGVIPNIGIVTRFANQPTLILM